MKKRLITALLGLTVVCLCGGGFSACFDYEKGTEGLIFECDNDLMEAYVVGYTGTDKRVFIPKEYNDLAVTGIADGAFENNTNITSVQFPHAMQYIGKRAFAECKNLTSAKKEDGSMPKDIGEEAFFECNKLTGTIDTFNVYERAFYGCDNITGLLFSTDYEIDSGATIAKEAFAYCRSLYSVTFQDEMSFVAENAFYQSNSVCYTVKDGLQYIPSESNPYYYLAGAEETLTSVVVDENCKLARKSALSNCTRLEEITLSFLGANEISAISHFGYIFGAESYTNNESCVPTTLKHVKYTGRTIKPYAFFGCKKLTEVEIPSVHTIKEGAFSGCQSLKTIDLSSVTVIENSVFANCRSLTELAINAATVGYGVLQNCTNLAKLEVRLGACTEHNNEIDAFYKFFGNSSADVPASLKEVTLLTGEKVYNDYFLNCGNIEKIVMQGAKQILDNAFAGCTALKEIVIPAGITTMRNAFVGCHTELVIYCKDTGLGDGWSDTWNCKTVDGDEYYEVVWGYTEN